MTVILTKDASALRWAQVRTSEAGTTCRDLYEHEAAIAPLWWDDASYARYQADDPQGYWKHELNFRRDGRGPIVAEFLYFEDEYDESFERRQASLSRQDRLVLEAAQAVEAERQEAERQAWLATYEEVAF